MYLQKYQKLIDDFETTLSFKIEDFEEALNQFILKHPYCEIMRGEDGNSFITSFIIPKDKLEIINKKIKLTEQHNLIEQSIFATVFLSDIYNSKQNIYKYENRKKGLISFYEHFNLDASIALSSFFDNKEIVNDDFVNKKNHPLTILIEELSKIYCHNVNDEIKGDYDFFTSNLEKFINDFQFTQKDWQFSQEKNQAEYSNSPFRCFSLLLSNKIKSSEPQEALQLFNFLQKHCDISQQFKISNIPALTFLVGSLVDSYLSNSSNKEQKEKQKKVLYSIISECAKTGIKFYEERVLDTPKRDQNGNFQKATILERIEHGTEETTSYSGFKDTIDYAKELLEDLPFLFYKAELDKVLKKTTKNNSIKV